MLVPVSLRHQTQRHQLRPSGIALRLRAPQVGSLRKLRMIVGIKAAVLEMLAAGQFLLRFGHDVGQKLGVQQDARDPPVIRTVEHMVQAARQHLVGRTDIDMPPMPAHQRHLAQCGGALRPCREKHTVPHAALYP